MLENPPSSFDGVDMLLSLGVRCGFFGYWLFDNLLILAKLKLFSKEAKSFLKPAMFSWWVALVLNLIFNVKKLRRLKASQEVIAALTNPPNPICPLLTLTPNIFHNPHPLEEVNKSPQDLTIPLIA